MVNGACSVGVVTRTLLATVAASFSVAAFADAPCFKADSDEALCLSAAELAATGVTSVRFVPKSFDAKTWRVLAYKAESTTEATVLSAAFTQSATTLLAALTRQEEICNELAEADVSCQRDHLVGAWKSYESGAGRAPFTARFTATATTTLDSVGSVETKQWACASGDAASRTETELTCTANYRTSLGEFYGTGKSRAIFSAAKCVAGETRVLAGSTQSGRECDATAAFAASKWLPLPLPAQIYVYSNASRTHLPQANVSLYFTGD